MTLNEVREKYLEFFKKRGHTIVPSASLVPENDPSVLFTTAGMQPLVPYLLGESHPAGKRLVNIQKCVRTGDIDEVGDNTHLTFFEMMGNWSLGDYFKEDAIKWSYELLTSKREGFGLDPKRFYITVFAGDENVSADEESAKIWEEVGMPKNRIYFLPASKNWWEAGPNGPCGPDTEMYYDLTEKGLGDLSSEQFKEADDKQQVVEIWNNVFMEYLKKDGKVISKLPKKNVDTGAGLERFCTVIQGKKSVFETDALEPIVKFIDEKRQKLRKKYLMSSATIEKSFDLDTKNWMKRNRIYADHFRSAAFMITDGVLPSNKERGYVLRRLMRRTMTNPGIGPIARDVFLLIEKMYSIFYKDLDAEYLNKIFQEELRVFSVSSEKGFKEVVKKYVTPNIHFEKGVEVGGDQIVSGEEAFYFFSTFGITKEVFLDYYSTVTKDFDKEYEKAFILHQKISRSGSEKKFKGGLADTSDMSVRYHTATHLLHQALRDVLGDEVRQKGSNITPERLRFDFAFPRKMTEEEKKKVEEIVNEKIKLALPVQKTVLPFAEAEKTGALHFFGEKYSDQVNVYYIGDSIEKAYSKEFCGGPHVENTSVIGNFKITKEEAVSAGVRRIKAVVTN